MSQRTKGSALLGRRLMGSCVGGRPLAERCGETSLSRRLSKVSILLLLREVGRRGVVGLNTVVVKSRDAKATRQ